MAARGEERRGQRATRQDRTRDAEWTPVLFGAREVGKSDADWKVESAGWRQISSCHHHCALTVLAWVVGGHWEVPAPTARNRPSPATSDTPCRALSLAKDGLVAD